MRTLFCFFVLAVALAPAAGGQAQCLPRTGPVYLCDDLTTGRSSAVVTGGRLEAGRGFTVLAEGDLLTYDLGTYIHSGTLRVVVTGVDESRLDGDSYILAMMHDHDGPPSDPTAFALRLGGDLGGAAPEGLGTLKLEAWDAAGEAARFTTRLPWSGSAVYVLDLELSSAREELAVLRDGVEIRRFPTSIPGPPIGDTVALRYRFIRVPMPVVGGHVFDAVVGSTVRAVSFDGISLDPEPAPVPDAGAAVPDAGAAPATPDAGARAMDAGSTPPLATDAGRAPPPLADAGRPPPSSTDAGAPRGAEPSARPRTPAAATSCSIVVRGSAGAPVVLVALALALALARRRFLGSRC